MTLLGIERVEDYLGYLRDTPQEAKNLLEDVLIHVTSFFRDPEVFDALVERVFPAILEGKKPGAPIRVWVAGCSTGEETYSLGIALVEYLNGRSDKHPVQIFGSDLSETAIESARAGVYSDTVLRDVSPERLSRFFSRVDNGARIDTLIRDSCVFVRHDLARDPPFSRLDLVSCRNALIYFGQPLQERVLGMFHYCLNQPGYLLLGRSESVSGFRELFAVVDRQNKIFSRAPGPSLLRFGAPLAGAPSERQPAARALPGAPRAVVDVTKHVDRLILSKYAPAGVVVNERMEILQFRGRSGDFLEPAAGQPQNHLLKMVREGLLGDVRAAFAQAKKELTVVKREGAHVRRNGQVRACSIIVVPIAGLPEPDERLFAVLFEDAAPSRRGAAAKPRTSRASGRRRPGKAEHELVATQEYLQSLIAEHQRLNDELSSANEELVSGNEELQSLNEEMETAKEELQSTNEELTTVNDEMQNRNQELNVLNGDLSNLLSSVDLPVIIVDALRRIRRFTPKARGIMNVLPTDVGRPIDDIRPNIEVTDLGQMIAEAIDSNTPRESEVRDRDGSWHRMRIRPYKTVDNKIEGAILSLTDIDALKRAASTAQAARDYFASIVEAVQVPLVVVESTMRAVSANEAFMACFNVSREKIEGRSLFGLCRGAFDVAELRTAMTEVVGQGTSFRGIEIERPVRGRGLMILTVSARPAPSPLGAPVIVVAIEDVSDRRRREKERAQLLEQAERAKEDALRANAAKDLFLAVLSHELRTPLTSMLLQIQRLGHGDLPAAKIKQACEAIGRAIASQAQLIDDLLDVSRISSGKLKMEMEDLDLGAVVATALDAVESLATKRSIEIETVIPTDPSVGRVSGDPLRLRQVIWNLLSNAIKSTPDGGRVTVALDGVPGHARIRVSDTGKGIDPQLLPHVFEQFVQAETMSTRARGGLGLGLTIVKNVVEAHGGTVSAESPGLGQGATFVVLIPLRDRVPTQRPSEVVFGDRARHPRHGNGRGRPARPSHP